MESTEDAKPDFERIWPRSQGRKFPQTASESTADLKRGQTRDDLQASLGDVKEII